MNYSAIIGNDELKKAFAEAAKGGKIAEFLKAQGCEATAEEISAFLKEKAGAQLSEEELDSVAGGECNDNTKHEIVESVVGLGVVCGDVAFYSALCGHTGQKKDGDGRLCTI